MPVTRAVGEAAPSRSGGGPGRQVITDLLNPEATHLIIRDDAKKGVYVDRLSQHVVHTSGPPHPHHHSCIIWTQLSAIFPNS